MKRVVTIFAFIVFLMSSTVGGVLVVLCPPSGCDAQASSECAAQASTECASQVSTDCGTPAPQECRPCCGGESACPAEEPPCETMPDQTRVILMPLLAINSCNVQRCANACGNVSLGDYREEQTPPNPDPGLIAAVAPSSFICEISPPTDIGTSRPPGVHPHLQTVVLRL